jgi:hypothetical protein
MKMFQRGSNNKRTRKGFERCDSEDKVKDSEGKGLGEGWIIGSISGIRGIFIPGKKRERGTTRVRKRCKCLVLSLYKNKN